MAVATEKATEKKFGYTSTTEDVLQGVRLDGKRALVTGVSAGLGVETARALVAHGAHVIGAARDLKKAETATGEVRKAAEQGGGSFELLEVDLASLGSVREAADKLNAAGEPLDLIIANAGVMACPFSFTLDGLEMQFGTNHIGHFLLINRVAGLLRKGARVVSLSSSGHRYGAPDLDDLKYEKTEYQPFLAYGRSKTANILFAVEFDRRWKEKGIRAMAVHPGGIMTELGRHLDPNALDGMIESINKSLAAEGKPVFVWKTIPQGAATSIWAGVVSEADEAGGRYCENCHVSTVVPDDKEITVVSEGVRAYALDPERAAALWAKSEDLVGERF